MWCRFHNFPPLFLIKDRLASNIKCYGDSLLQKPTRKCANLVIISLYPRNRSQGRTKTEGIGVFESHFQRSLIVFTFSDVKNETMAKRDI